jgi:hypothetical protein
MERVQARVRDGKATRLVLQFLKAGVLTHGFLLPTEKGTLQGRVIRHCCQYRTRRDRGAMRVVDPSPPEDPGSPQE